MSPSALENCAAVRNRSAGDLASTCRACHAESMNLMRLRKRIGKARHFAGELRRAVDAVAARRVARAAICSFGSPKDFLVAWGAAVAAAKPGSLAATNLLTATLRLAELAEPPRRQAAIQDELTLLTDEELEQQLQHQLRALADS